MATTFAVEHKVSSAIPFPRVKLAVCVLVLTLLAGTAAYFNSFSHMAVYDDEGYLMANVDQFLNGQVLYDQIAIFHAPMFFLYERAAHHFSGADLSHDSVRFISVTFWVITTVICFLLVYKLTGSVLMAGIAQAVIFRDLLFLSDEPAHPQEACILLLALVGLQACYSRNRAVTLISLGILTGTLVVTKINLGAYVLLALGIAFFCAVEKGPWQRAGLWSASSAALILPALLMLPHISEPWAAAFCLVEVLSIAAVVLAVARSPIAERFRWQHFLLAVAACIATTLVISSVLFARGTTPAAMLKWLVVWPATRFQYWFLPPPISPWAVAWAALSPLAAWQFWVKTKNYTAITLLKAGFVALMILLCLEHYWVLWLAGPFVWLVAVPPAGSIHDSQRFGRTVLALVGALQVLYAYPVAGSQLRFVTAFLTLAAAVCSSDVLAAVREEFPIQWQRARLERFAGVAVLLVGAYYVQCAWRAYHSYETLAQLNLPGSSLIHLEAHRAAGLERIVATVRSSCTSLVTAPGMYSFNLWTGVPGPKLLLLSNDWMDHLTDLEQAEVAREFSRDPRGCVIYSPRAAKVWTKGKDISSKPLMRFINQNFHVANSEFGYQLMLPN